MAGSLPRMRTFLIGLVALTLAGCSAGAGATPGTSDAGASTPDAPTSEAPTSEAPMASDDPTAGPSDDGGAAFDDPLLTTTMTDVRTGASFTLAELAASEPVIVEMMAIWCTNCRTQMREITAAHGTAEFHSVSIDVDPSEIAEDLAAYSAREGFDWPFALADAALATQIRDRFGNEALFPPNTPKLLVGTDGSVTLLPLGRLFRADELAALVGG